MNKHYRPVVAIIALVIFVLAANAEAATLEVGLSGYPYTSIQAAIDAAQTGDTVLVHLGIYIGPITFAGDKTITVKSETGHYSSNTAIDGDSRGSVVSFIGANNSTLEGFIIKNGRGTDVFGTAYGGGIYCNNSSPSIKNCLIVGNSAGDSETGRSGYGGGIYCKDASPAIFGSIIINNTAAYEGGGIYCSNSSLKIDNCEITTNSTTFSGGGICIRNFSSPTILRSVIKENSARNGGGIFCYHNSTPTIDRCTIKDNTTDAEGAGILCGSSSSPTLSICTISGNSAGTYGGGIYCSYSSPTFTNCTISGNLASEYGGGIYCSTSSPSITNCTLSGNSAGSLGGGILGGSSDNLPIVVVNTIVWGNTAPSYNEVWLAPTSSISITYSDINMDDPLKPPYPGIGNINADPRFVDPRDASLAPTSEGDYHLTPGASPCIDVGTDEGAPPNDIDGASRPRGTGYDIGADEVCQAGWYKDSDGDKYSDGIIITQCDYPGEGYYAAYFLIATSGDCNDNDPEINPSVVDVCNGDGVDNDCDGKNDEDCMVIDLAAGWNLVSSSVVPLDTAIAGTLGIASDFCNSVWVYNNGWKAYFPSYPVYSDLETMDAGWGYWLNMRASTTLTVNGKISSDSISIEEGWNLVGYNSSTPLPITDALDSITENCESVWQFKDGEWKAFYPDFPVNSDLETMEPNYGYWIKTKQACTWTLP